MILRRMVLLVLRGYQILISPLLGPRCRFHPTCSRYAMDAIERHGILRGAWLALCRLARCHPGCEGGIDPVPEAFRWRPWRASAAPAGPDGAALNPPGDADRDASSPGSNAGGHGPH